MELMAFAAGALVKIGIVMIVVLTTVAFLTLAERKVLSWMQDRMGPMEVGPYGILQPLADGLKLFFKEDIIPTGANWVLFSLAPILSLVPALIGFAVIPYGPNKQVELFGYTFNPFVITDINIGILYILAFASIGAYGIILGGWSSNNKYSLLGAMRVIAMAISYEIPMVLALLGVVLFAGTMDLNGIVFWQRSHNTLLILLQPLAALIYFIAASAELNRTPLDIAEARSDRRARGDLFAHGAAPSRGVAPCGPVFCPLPGRNARSRSWIAALVSASLYGPGPESCSAR